MPVIRGLVYARQRLWMSLSILSDVEVIQLLAVNHGYGGKMRSVILLTRGAASLSAVINAKVKLSLLMGR